MPKMFAIYMYVYVYTCIYGMRQNNPPIAVQWNGTEQVVPFLFDISLSVHDPFLIC